MNRASECHKLFLDVFLPKLQIDFLVLLAGGTSELVGALRSFILIFAHFFDAGEAKTAVTFQHDRDIQRLFTTWALHVLHL